MQNPFALVARSTRNQQTENWHFGACAVSTPDGRLLAATGNPEQRFFMRSAAKPFQAVPLLMAGGKEHFDLNRSDLALICASHSGTPAHVRGAAELLIKGSFHPEDLRCGTHEPLDTDYALELRCSRVEPEPLHNNCSGKHAGLLLACRLLGLSTENYFEPDHPLQLKILREIAVFTGLEEGLVGLAIDGCGVLTYRVPLKASARAFAALADPERAGLEGNRLEAVGCITQSMASAPSMVAGPGRFTTRLIKVTNGRILGKEGAEGFYGVAVGGSTPLGVTLKIADGSEACRDGVVLSVLRQLDCLTAKEFRVLREFFRPRMQNHQEWVVGEMVPEIELQEIEG